MKKYIIIALVVIVGGSLLIMPLLKSDPSSEVQAEDAPAKFTFEQNLQLTYDQDVEIFVDVLADDIQKLEVVYDDSVIQIWKNPTKNVSFKFNASLKGVGAKSFNLLSTLKDGSSYVDNRMLRVISNINPELLTAEIVASYPHNRESFTQGLAFYNGNLYEGTGVLGKSFVAEVDLKTGTINPNKRMGLDGNYFGEGITILNDVLYQLTWQNHKCITYDLNERIIPKKDFAYTGEGWGICNDGENLIMSDGTERISFRDPETFGVIKTIEVYNNRGPITALNELEFINGKIYANVWTTNMVVVIDPITGMVEQQIDASSLEIEGRLSDQDVLNGIAFNSETGKIYMTGKNWLKLFEVKFVKKAV